LFVYAQTGRKKRERKHLEHPIGKNKKGSGAWAQPQTKVEYRRYRKEKGPGHLEGKFVAGGGHGATTGKGEISVAVLVAIAKEKTREDH